MNPATMITPVLNLADVSSTGILRSVFSGGLPAVGLDAVAASTLIALIVAHLGLVAWARVRDAQPATPAAQSPSGEFPVHTG